MPLHYFERIAKILLVVGFGCVLYVAWGAL